MKAVAATFVETVIPAEAYAARPRTGTDSRVADYLQLVRPRVAVMVLVTVALGGWLAAPGVIPPTALWHAVLGVGLVTAGASILNQLLERDTDARMLRTRHRPLPAGRLGAYEVLTLGSTASVTGLVYMALTVPDPAAALLTALTFVLYVFAYTAAKRTTTLNTLIGAVPGALPPVIGWTAVTGRIDAGAVALFLLVFVWQVPHFLAIAWMYRDDYRRAGLKMLPVDDPNGDVTARQMLLYGLTLVPVSLWPLALRMAGPGYALGAVILALAFLWPIARFYRRRTIATARRVLRASLVYLPGILAFLLISKYWLP
jgi:protoheme IX farnesyltransferase